MKLPEVYPTYLILILQHDRVRLHWRLDSGASAGTLQGIRRPWSFPGGKTADGKMIPYF